jgi:hypothetical protein
LETEEKNRRKEYEDLEKTALIKTAPYDDVNCEEF